VQAADAQTDESILARLEALGITQAGFAEIAEVSSRTVSNLVHGRTQMPSSAWLLLETLELYPEVRAEFIWKSRGRPRGKPFAQGNPYRFGDMRRAVYVAGAQYARAAA
jgi:lambda repressor-like predicted transcriptional regulator